ncbi:DUF4262 domain-containing protein [Paenibacillus sp. FSL R7-0302]|uniref:DUF4262 domain-containing protein n=1 Tax=Paenibacillus sp. FSL R7-0302 TaxID=2921681 RepID=UPI0030FB5A6B
MATATAEMGWHANVVPSSQYDGIHANYNTNGVKESFGHLDFQVILPIEPKQTHAVIISLIESIKQGKVYEEGVLYDGIIGFPMGFKRFVECGREVLRLMIPDRLGRHPDDPECEEFFKIQMNDFPFDDFAKERLH